MRDGLTKLARHGMRCGLALLTAGVLLGQAGRAQAASTYYVVFTGGDDTNPCTLAEPCQSIHRAVDVAVDGDTIQISTGNFLETLVITERLTLRGAGSGLTKINANGEGRAVEINVTSGAGNQVTLENLLIRNGLVDGNGAGIGLSAGNLVLRNVVVRNNVANGDSQMGGGIYCTNARVDIFDSTITENQAYGGAGLAVDAGCQLNMDGSAVYLNQGSRAAGVLVTLGTANLINVTVSFNSAVMALTPIEPRAGGMEVEAGGHAALNHVTLAFNQAADSTDAWQLWARGAVVLSNTLLHSPFGPACRVESGALSSGGYNLSSDATCALSGTGDLVNSDPQLSGLTDNGGAAYTHALAQTSPAVDAAGPPGPRTPTHDQRGLAYRDGDFDGVVRGDIGAFEYQPRGLWLPLVVR